jgi:hypothetical protein
MVYTSQSNEHSCRSVECLTETSTGTSLTYVPGGNVNRPIATKFADRLEIVGAGHYEIVPETIRPAPVLKLATAAAG